MSNARHTKNLYKKFTPHDVISISTTKILWSTLNKIIVEIDDTLCGVSFWRKILVYLVLLFKGASTVGAPLRRALSIHRWMGICI